ncbi:MAG: polysaccharide deacetylase family protein [Myxococcales bacterium]|jgi:peptidoglycan/xylan/chitin deacetylase (PgdA/CDA1 family)
MRRGGWERACSAVVLGLCALAWPYQASAAAQTVVSITFDDTIDNQWRARALLRAHGMNATFYVNSPRVGAPGYLGLDQLLTLQAEGDEIGSHTLHHARLTELSTAEQRVEICEDRARLMAMGFAVSSFAYPFGADDASARQVVAECGYTSARDVSGIRSPTGCFTCPYAETIPPGAPYLVRSTPSVRRTTTLEVLKGYVTQAEQHGGGWVPIVLHHVCDGCNEYAISEATLDAFLAWLKQRKAQGTVVRTVAEVMGSGSPPPPPPGPNLLKNASLEQDSDGNGTPDCWQRGGYGTNTFTWSRTSDAHSGNWAQRVTVTSLDSGDRKLVSAQDSGTCAPLARAGHTYLVSAWYKADAPTRFAAYYRTADGRWVWWAQSQTFPATATYKQVTWETPPFPEGARFISVGYSVLAPGSMTVDDFSLMDAAGGSGDTIAPQIALVRPAEGAVVSGLVTFEAQASDETAMGSVEFLVDGKVVGTATSSTGLYAITWDSTSVANGPVAVAAMATDAAGNAALSTSRTVLVSNEVAQPGPNLLKNPSLEQDSDGNGTPDCWQRGGYGTNTFTWSRTSDAHSGNWAQRVTVTSLDSGDRKLVSAQDSGTCAPLARAGHTYLVSAWYKADAPTRFAAYYRTADGRWVWWAQSPTFPATSTYVQVSWVTPPFPEGAAFISVGYSLLAPGSMTVDDLSLSETTGP